MQKRAYRPPSGLPSREPRSKWESHAASVVVHALLLALVVAPTVHSDFRGTPALGAGGAGPAGGGGRGGAGQRIQFVAMRAPALPPRPAQADMVQVAPPPVPQPAPTVAAPAPAVTDQVSGAAGAGVGGEGAGPGTGGGVGSGVGPGRGTGVGPGTGGGTADQHPPAVTQFFLPPTPIPPRIRPYTMIAWFDVDERGNATLLGFNPSRDNAYNRKLRDVLTALRFRPAVRADGTPVRDTVDVQYIFR